MLRTISGFPISGFPKYPNTYLFRLNPLNQFLIKKYPRKGDNGFLTNYWLSYLFATNVLKDVEYIDNITSITIMPKDYYKMPNPSISSCLGEWLEMYKKDKVPNEEYVILDSIPGTSEPLSIEVEGIPDEVRSELTEVFKRLNKDGFIDPKDIEED